MSQMNHGVWSGLAVCVLTVSAATLYADAQPSLEKALAEHGYRAGAAVEHVSGFRLDDWTAVDSKHLIVHGDAAQAYLVTFEFRCYGLGGKRLGVRTRAPGVLAAGDEFQVKHMGQVADRCLVDALQRLESASGS